MPDPIKVGNTTIHRIVEQEGPFFEMLKFFPALTKEVLEENRAWLQPQVHEPQGRAHALHPELPGADAPPQHPDRYLRRQRQAAPRRARSGT